MEYGCYSLSFSLVGEPTWLIAFLGFVCLFSIIAFIVGYQAIIRRSMDQLSKVQSPDVHFIFADKTLQMQSDLGKAEIPWEKMEKLWKFPDVWLLLVTKVNYITLPTSALDEELQHFIVIKMER